MLALLRPSFWGGHLLMVLAMAAAVALGLWQLDAWHRHREADARARSGEIQRMAPVPLGTLMTGDSPFPGNAVGRPVTLQGRWLGQDTVYVEGRLRHGRRGFWAVTPVLVDGTRSAMPVVRGWLPQPHAPAVSGPARVTGWLQPGEGSGIVDPNPHDDLLPELRIASLVEHVEVDLYGGYVVTEHTTEPGLEQVAVTSIPDVSGFTALRNLLYAIQWWLFGGFAIYMWVRWCRDSLVVLEAERLTSDG